VKFGISYNTGVYGVDPDGMIAVARHAEDCGFESFYVPEHIALYPGAKVGAVEFPPALPIVDPLETLSFVAAATERILLGTGVLLLPYHYPVVLAKRLATIDVLSQGRMRLLTVGVGALPGEAQAAGVDFATRGRRADEAIDVLRLLWAGDENGVSFDGEFFSFQNFVQLPQAVRHHDAADPRRGIEPGRSPPGRPTGRRLFPRGPAHRRGTSQPDRDHVDGRRPGRPGSRRAGVHPVGIDRHVRRRRRRPCPQRDGPAGGGRHVA